MSNTTFRRGMDLLSELRKSAPRSLAFSGGEAPVFPEQVREAGCLALGFDGGDEGIVTIETLQQAPFPVDIDDEPMTETEIWVAKLDGLGIVDIDALREHLATCPDATCPDAMFLRAQLDDLRG